MLPRNMGRRHRLAYAAFGVATIAAAVALGDLHRGVRIVLGLMGLSALGSSLSGYCVTCHTFGVTTKGDRIRRVS